MHTPRPFNDCVHKTILAVTTILDIEGVANFSVDVISRVYRGLFYFNVSTIDSFCTLRNTKRIKVLCLLQIPLLKGELCTWAQGALIAWHTCLTIRDTDDLERQKALAHFWYLLSYLDGLVLRFSIWGCNSLHSCWKLSLHILKFSPFFWYHNIIKKIHQNTLSAWPYPVSSGFKSCTHHFLHRL